MSDRHGLFNGNAFRLGLPPLPAGIGWAEPRRVE
jgi:hypothetical protein